MRIGQVAQRAGVGIETIRFYERRGLLDPPPRRPSGYREYPQDAVRRLLFIRRAKQLGFSLKEIGELLSLRVGHGASCKAVKQRALSKIADIEEKLRHLQRLKRTLRSLTHACEERSSTDECPILESLELRG